MEAGNPSLYPLDHPYTFHDGAGQDPLDDVRRIAVADVRVSANGNYAALIHWGAKHGLSILPTNEGGYPSMYENNHRIKVAYQGGFVNGAAGCEVLEEALRIPQA